MKKVYVKPELVMEDFKLTENIASCDESFANHWDVLGTMMELGYFNSGCETELPVGFPIEGLDDGELCYFTSVRYVFSS